MDDDDGHTRGNGSDERDTRGNGSNGNDTRGNGPFRKDTRGNGSNGKDTRGNGPFGKDTRVSDVISRGERLTHTTEEGELEVTGQNLIEDDSETSVQFSRQEIVYEDTHKNQKDIRKKCDHHNKIKKVTGQETTTSRSRKRRRYHSTSSEVRDDSPSPKRLSRSKFRREESYGPRVQRRRYSTSSESRDDSPPLKRIRRSKPRIKESDSSMDQKQKQVSEINGEETGIDRYVLGIKVNGSVISCHADLGSQCSLIRHRKAPTQYEVGDLVRIERQVQHDGKSQKLSVKYQGPYRIVKLLPNDRFLVEDTPLTRKHGRKYEAVVAIDKIQPWMNFNRDLESGSSENEVPSENE
ncbi:Transposon Ty3-G Gag-Pol polyprotein [Operophtera brumata]|uniref:Transposon Ty3-G Gag-Pol polyprotein n=1 Tax=Operophtera brumata TaxID=104452 RepID=A0A0L7LQ69_OPEBR|nr:Transposon Ty3-G Gag-Pol polyprotein [Operophtera brumata]